MSIKRICVFCGSNEGKNPLYRQSATALAAVFARKKIGLVYGGGSTGIMGAVADAVLKTGGEAIGVIPKLLFIKEVAHAGLTDLKVVNSMHERKALMAELSDAFIALPGGMGTFEELCEILTWAQLGLHRKSVGILNVAGFYTPYLQFIEHAITEGFIRPEQRNLFVHADTPEELLEKMIHHQLPPVPAWLTNSSQT